MDNYARGTVAEVLVAELLGGQVVGDGYGSWDIEVASTRVEVKASGSIQSWPQKRPSIPQFSITKSKGWTQQEDGSFVEDDRKLRRSDVYIFCHHAGIKPDHLDEWTFYVVPTARIDDVCRDQRKINLSAVISRLEPATCEASELSREFEEVLLGAPVPD